MDARHLFVGVLLTVAIVSCGEEPRDDATKVPPSRVTTTTPVGGLSKGAPPSSSGPVVTSPAPGERPLGGGSPKPSDSKSPTSSPPGGGANPCGTPPAGRAADGRTPQKIAFPELGSHQWPDKEVRLQACATSGLPVAYEFDHGGRGGQCYVVDPSTTSIAKAQGDTLTCQVTAIQPGNVTFAPAEPVTVTWVVSKLVVKVGWLGSGDTLVYSPGGPSAPLQAKITAMHAIPYLQLYTDAVGACAISRAPTAVGGTGQKSITVDVEVGLTDPGAQGASCDLTVTVGANQLTDGSRDDRHYTVTSSP